ncbi:MAG TPA: acyl carrier protein [Steroidobacteraceae bacterium]|nr:acyl carrier protein [Steroidobacteraceae bacterium]
MSIDPIDDVLLTRIHKAFRTAFGSRVPFNGDLDRVHESRWTSLKHVEFLVALEQEFGLRFDGTDATDLVSIKAVRERVAARLAIE